MSKENINKELDYKTLLNRIYISLPERTLTASRFELPIVESIVQGKQTIWKNFSKAAKDLKRDESQLYKFVMREISTSSAIISGTLVLNGVFNNYKMNELLTKYIKNFVLCSACKKPDTEIVVHEGVKVMRCTACGAMTPIPKF